MWNENDKIPNDFTAIQLDQYKTNRNHSWSQSETMAVCHKNWMWNLHTVIQTNFSSRFILLQLTYVDSPTEALHEQQDKDMERDKVDNKHVATPGWNLKKKSNIFIL